MWFMEVYLLLYSIYLLMLCNAILHASCIATPNQILFCFFILLGWWTFGSVSSYLFTSLISLSSFLFSENYVYMKMTCELDYSDVHYLLSIYIYALHLSLPSQLDSWPGFLYSPTKHFYYKCRAPFYTDDPFQS